MFDTGHDFSSRSTIAPQLVCDDHARDIPQPFQKLAKELLCGLLVPALLNQNIQYVSILIYRTPQVMELSVDL
jgi:hypothetical protein